MVKTAQQMLDNWKAAMGSATTQQRYKQGIGNTTVNPMQLAAAPDALARYQQATADSVTSGRRAAALNNASMQVWKDNAINIGAARLSTGATKASPKYQAYAQKWQPILQGISDHVRSMPKGGVANAQARSAYVIQQMMAAAGKA